MNNIKLNNGEALDSTYITDTVNGIFGFILESWGPKNRNPEYAKAMEQILSMLIKSNVPFINVYVISRNLTRAFPDINDRAITINGSTNINLAYRNPHDLRILIGREVANLKESSSQSSKGGNRFKRVLIHAPLLKEQDWHSIAEGVSLDVYKPTVDDKKIESIVLTLQNEDIGEPKGTSRPEQCGVTSDAFLRDPLVKAWVLRNAGGNCEACQLPAPFARKDGSPYLEVHHLLPFSEGGSDTIDNALAVCPNCHRRLHYGVDKTSFAEDVKTKISRLNQNDSS